MKTYPVSYHCLDCKTNDSAESEGRISKNMVTCHRVGHAVIVTHHEPRTAPCPAA